MGSIDDYDPANEDDPIKIQKEQLAISKRFMAKIEREEAEAKRKKEEYAAASPPVAGYASAYTPPTFEEVSAVLKKTWDEVERIMPTAKGRVKCSAFQTLMQAAFPRGPFGM